MFKSNTKKFLIITSDNPSSKYRVALLKKNCEHYSRKYSPYPPVGNFRNKIKWYILNTIETIVVARKYKNHTIIQNKISSKYPIAELLYKNVIYDIDDRIWNKGIQRLIFSIIIRKASGVVVANERIYRVIKKMKMERIMIARTPVSEIYSRSRMKKKTDSLNIKPYLYWCVQSIGFTYINESWKELLREIGLPLKIVMERKPLKEEKNILSSLEVDYDVWIGEQADAANIADARATIMPLGRDKHSMYKSSYKALCSLKLGVPVIVTPTGYNSKLLNKSSLAISMQKGAKVILKLIENPEYLNNLDTNEIINIHSADEFFKSYSEVFNDW